MRSWYRLVIKGAGSFVYTELCNTWEYLDLQFISSIAIVLWLKTRDRRLVAVLLGAPSPTEISSARQRQTSGGGALVCFGSAARSERRKCLLDYVVVFSELRAVFSIFDMDRDGYITIDEVMQVLVSMGFSPSKECILDVFHQVDLDGLLCFLHRSCRLNSDNFFRWVFFYRALIESHALS